MREEFDALVRSGLDQSPVTEVLVEESIIGWKEYEMEVMRDKDDSVVIICLETSTRWEFTRAIDHRGPSSNVDR